MFITTDELLERIERLERSRYILVQDAAVKYGVSRITINKKVKKYGVERFRSGKAIMINEYELIEALKQKEPKPTFSST